MINLIFKSSQLKKSFLPISNISRKERLNDFEAKNKQHCLFLINKRTLETKWTKFQKGEDFIFDFPFQECKSELFFFKRVMKRHRQTSFHEFSKRKTDDYKKISEQTIPSKGVSMLSPNLLPEQLIQSFRIAYYQVMKSFSFIAQKQNQGTDFISAKERETHFEILNSCLSDSLFKKMNSFCSKLGQKHDNYEYGITLLNEDNCTIEVDSILKYETIFGISNRKELLEIDHLSYEELKKRYYKISIMSSDNMKRFLYIQKSKPFSSSFFNQNKAFLRIDAFINSNLKFVIWRRKKAASSSSSDSKSMENTKEIIFPERNANALNSLTDIHTEMRLISFDCQFPFRKFPFLLPFNFMNSEQFSNSFLMNESQIAKTKKQPDSVFQENCKQESLIPEDEISQTNRKAFLNKGEYKLGPEFKYVKRKNRRMLMKKRNMYENEKRKLGLEEIFCKTELEKLKSKGLFEKKGSWVISDIDYFIHTSTS